MNDYLLLHTTLLKLTKLYIKAEEAQQLAKNIMWKQQWEKFWMRQT